MVLPNKEHAAKSIAAAKRSLDDPEITSVDAAEQAGIPRGGVTYARMILRFGTAADVLSALEGTESLRAIRDRIKSKLTPEQLATLQERDNGWTTKRRALIASEGQVWSDLSTTIKKLLSLPSPEDVVRIAKKNHVRSDFVNQQLFAVHKWMEDFVEQWSKPDSQ